MNGSEEGGYQARNVGNHAWLDSADFVDVGDAASASGLDSGRLRDRAWAGVDVAEVLLDVSIGEHE